MGLILAAIVAILTVLLALLVLFADGMSDAPSVQGISPWPTLIIGFGISAILVLIHFVGW